MAPSYGDGTAADGRGRELPQILALALGVIYTLIGLLGFLVTGFDKFAGVTGKTLLGFEINPLHNIAHLLVGVLGIVLAKTLASARTYGWLLAVVYGALFVFGLFVAGRNDSLNFLSLNAADNILHLLSTLVGLVIALLPVRRKAAYDTR